MTTTLPSESLLGRRSLPKHLDDLHKVTRDGSEQGKDLEVVVHEVSETCKQENNTHKYTHKKYFLCSGSLCASTTHELAHSIPTKNPRKRGRE